MICAFETRKNPSKEDLKAVTKDYEKQQKTTENPTMLLKITENNKKQPN